MNNLTVGQITEIDRAARAYGWEVGRNGAMLSVVKLSKKNPFSDPNWRGRIIYSEGGNMKNSIAFVVGGVIALAGVVIGNGVKTAAKPAAK